MEKGEIDEIRRVHWREGYSIYKETVKPKFMLNTPGDKDKALESGLKQDLKQKQEQWKQMFLTD